MIEHDPGPRRADGPIDGPYHHWQRVETPAAPPARTPWGLRHILAILALAFAGWAVVGGAALATRRLWLAHALVVGLGLTIALYAILYAAIVLVIRGTGGWGALGYRRLAWGDLLRVLAWLPALYLAAGAAAFASAYAFNGGRPIPSNTGALFPGGISGVGKGTIVLAFVVAALVAPLVEETFFRGVLYQWLRGRLGIAPAVLLSGLLFGAAHLAGGIGGLWKLIPVLAVMGCFLAVIFQRSRSLFASMLLHGTNNALAIVALLVGLSH